jgi:hypothetical protein
MCIFRSVRGRTFQDATYMMYSILLREFISPGDPSSRLGFPVDESLEDMARLLESVVDLILDISSNHIQTTCSASNSITTTYM